MSPTRRRFLAGAAALVAAPPLPVRASAFVWVPLLDAGANAPVGEALCERAWAERHGLTSCRDATPDDVAATVRVTIAGHDAAERCGVSP
jgi:hypothetical protein